MGKSIQNATQNWRDEQAKARRARLGRDDESKLPSAPSPAEETCEHQWGDTRDDTVQRCKVCLIARAVPEPVSTEGAAELAMLEKAVEACRRPQSEAEMLAACMTALQPMAAPIAPAAVSETGHAANLESELAIARDLIATMRARIEELERERDHTWTQRNADLFVERNAAWAKLRAVSDALEEKMQHWTPQGAEWAYYVKSEVDARDARIRAILEGK